MKKLAIVAALILLNTSVAYAQNRNIYYAPTYRNSVVPRGYQAQVPYQYYQPRVQNYGTVKKCYSAYTSGPFYGYTCQ